MKLLILHCQVLDKVLFLLKQGIVPLFDALDVLHLLLLLLHDLRLKILDTLAHLLVLTLQLFHSSLQSLFLLRFLSAFCLQAFELCFLLLNGRVELFYTLVHPVDLVFKSLLLGKTLLYDLVFLLQSSAHLL